MPLDALDVGYTGGLRAQFPRGQAEKAAEDEAVRTASTRPRRLPLATAGCREQTAAASAHNVQCALSLFLCSAGN